ncbi:MAG: formate dehydrogenase [Methylibium sp.]|uniref:formate dehydrogenase n=1 Tax=Methylibium sp. TaxID=2067992 RepID=UPI0017912AE0|nr:formate dehydrogenase [Methylibium sp.]MBA3599171.1 formate dehydrogenase [Methylibium sp.]
MTKTVKSSAAPVARRGLLIGAGVAGATAVVAGKLSAVAPAATEVSAAGAALADTPSGYRVTAHVQRYYQTTKI